MDLATEIARLRPVLLGLSRRFTNDPEASNDLVQDTLTRALVYSKKYRVDNNLTGWLFTIMRNTYINGYKQNRRGLMVSLETQTAVYRREPDRYTYNLPEKRFEYEEIMSKVDSIAFHIVEPFRMYFNGYRYREIAETLGLPIGTVKNRIFQARKEIQKQLVDNQRVTRSAGVPQR